MLPEVAYSLVDNYRYIIDYIEGIYEDTKQPYFKIIIKNKISRVENFIVVSYDMRDITIKVQGVELPDDEDLETILFPLEKFTNGKLRRLFFVLFQARIIADTLPRKKKPKEITEPQEHILNPYIDVLHDEIHRLRMIAERNKQLILEANAKKMALQIRRKKEINKMLGNSNDHTEIIEK